MKIATREKALIGVALAVAGFVAFGPSGSNTVEPARAPAAARAAPPEAVDRAAFGEPPPVGGIMTRLAHRVAGAAADAALFATHSWYTPPPPPRGGGAATVIAPPVPTAPPLPFAYMGSYRRDGGKQVYFLTRNDRIYDVSAGDTIDGVYTFEGLNGANLVFTYKPLKMRQTLAVDGDQ